MATAEAELEVGGRTVRISSPGRVRGVPEATVSTPITWAEIDDVEPRECTIATVPGRYARLGDLLAGIDDAAYSLDTLLEWGRPRRHRLADRSCHARRT